MRALPESRALTLSSAPLGRVFALVAALVFSAGCADEPPVALTTDHAPAFDGVWQGSLVVTTGPMAGGRRIVAGEKGVATLDLRPISANELEGTVVLFWAGLADQRRARVRGTPAGMELTLATLGFGDTMSFQLARADSTNLSGTFSVDLGAGVAGTIDLARIPSAGLSLQTFFTDLPGMGVTSMVFDADTLWLSTVGNDYVLLTHGAVLADTVPVFYSPGTHWTSDVLARGGGRLWGHIREGVNASTLSRVLPFTREGIQSGDFLLEHLSHGLAHDGTHLWSLHSPTQTLFRITEAGAVVDSAKLANPDLRHLEWDGVQFWSMGWFLPLLWQIAPTGETIAVHRLPAGFSFPTGLAYDGQYVYCAQSDLGMTRILKFAVPIGIP